MVTISTAGWDVDGPLGRLRTRALALPDVKRDGPLTRAIGASLAMLEWAVPEDADVDDPNVVKQANPASSITADGLAEQRAAGARSRLQALPREPVDGRQTGWLPPGAWQACVGQPEFVDGERIVIAVDLGGTRSASAVCWINEQHHVAPAGRAQPAGRSAVPDRRLPPG